MRTGILVAALATLLLAASAHADSIVYTDQGDLYYAYADGSHPTLIANDPAEPYDYPSVADDGTIAAIVGGDTLRLFDRAGAKLRDVPLVNAGANPNWGDAYYAVISPDGTKAAVFFAYEHTTPGPACPLPTCNPGFNQVVVVTSTSEATPIGELGLYQGWVEPSWVDDDTLLLARGTGQPGLAQVGDRATTVNPWAIAPYVERNQGVINRQGTLAAFVADYRHILMYRLAGLQTTPCTLAFSSPDDFIRTLSFAPDGGGLAWQENGRVWVARPGADCAAQTAPQAIIGSGGVDHAFWGAGDIPGKPRPVVTPEPTPTPTPTPQPTPTPTPQPAAPKLAAGGKLPKLRKLGRQRTIPVRVTCDGACSLTVSATIARSLAKRLKIKAAVARARASGGGTVKLKLARKTARKLARQKKVTLQVRATGTNALGAPVSASAALVLKR